MTKYEMEQEIGRLKNKKSDLVSKKVDTQGKISAINAQIVGRLDNRLYAELQRKKSDYLKIFNNVEAEIQELNIKIRKLSIDKSAPVTENISLRDTVQALVAIRDEYQAFSADHTRVSSMRQMAAEFVMKLNPIIRKAVNE